MLDKKGVYEYNNQCCREREQTTAAVLENDIVKRQIIKNSQISERDNGIGSQLALTEEEVKD